MESDHPTYYIYKDEDGKAFKTTPAVTKQINAVLFLAHGAFDTGGRELYPQWGKPEMMTRTRTAWRVTKKGSRAVRWSWCYAQHHKGHHRCHQLGDGRCVLQKVRRLSYDTKLEIWTLVEMPEIASGSDVPK